MERMPLVYLPHGGGPWPFVELGLPRREIEDLAGYLRGLGALPKSEPKAVLVISAHWEKSTLSVMTGERPPLYFDYYGFPPESYELRWPAPGAPELASRVGELLGAAGWDVNGDPDRGYDHGLFIPLMLTYPEAHLPTTQLSLRKGLDPAEHLAIGRALAPLRNEGIFIIGSGMSYHNMRAFADPHAGEDGEIFDAWLRKAVVAPPRERDEALRRWEEAPSARAVHPREEHLLPLMVISGAAGEDRGTLAWSGTYMGKRISAFHFG